MKRLRILGALTLALAAACAEREPDHDDHGHEHEAEAPERNDSHHAAENRARCEDDVVLSAEAQARYGVAIGPVREMSLAPLVSAPGHLAFPQGSLARVGSAVAGRVAEVRVRSGDTVHRGDTLLVIESPSLGEAQSDYLQKRTIAETAGPALEVARTALERAKELHERVQGISLTEVQKREVELKTAERDREVARAAETAAHNRLLLLGMDEKSIETLRASGKVEPRSLVRAPIDGKLVEVSATLGELVGPDKDRLLVVGDLRVLWAIAEVSESRLSEVAVGARATVRVPALGDETREGRVAAAPTVLEASTRTAEVRIEVQNPDERMLPGMFIQVDIESSRGGGAPVLAVPDGAVLDIEGRPSVFVPVEPGGALFCKHDVEVGAPVGEHLPVLSGLKAGDLVVVAGTFRLKAEHGKASAKHEH